ncbi:DUF3892 domain-containing protein [Salipaludibacillus sp. CF4.18]|uniref:DUF3892 domain-containing protein n=1 Tax=Salipaludibacillus sp. CF4.18 TaxID=3373081 RepID=UPI003EE60DED
MDSKNFEDIYNQYKTQGANNTNDYPENVNSTQEQIVAVRKNEDNDIIAFKTESGKELDYVSALEEAKSGNLAHIDVFHRYSRDIIRSEPDGSKDSF